MISETDEILSGPTMLDIDCQHLVQRVVDFIRHSDSRLIVLHGRSNSGKTELIRQWVIPALRAQKEVGEVWFGDCAPGFPDVVEGAPTEGADPQSVPFDTLVNRKSVVFIDTFDNVFDAPREERRAILSELFGKLQQPDARATVVLITDTKHLTSVYGLGVYDSKIVDAVFDIGSISVADALQQLAAAQPYGAPAYSKEVLSELENDAESLEQGNVGVTFDLLTILDGVFRAKPQLAQQAEQYTNAGRLTGILRAHLDETLKRLTGDDENAEAVARGVLERVVDAHTQGIPFGSDDLLPRLAVSREDLHAMLRRLIDHNLLREIGTDAYLPVPLQLTTILQQDLADHRLAQDRIIRILDEALRSWTIVGNLLPRSRFKEIHQERRKLVLGNEHTRFMLQNGLRHGDGDLDGAAYYWLRRLPNKNEGADVLLASLFSDVADVRLRAAQLLRRFPEPDVRARLHAVALTDPDARVRDQAVTSLEPMKTDGLLSELLREVNEEKSNYRIPAIETLKLFKDPRVTDALAGIVKKPTSTPAVRKNALTVLGEMNTVESVDALLATALTDDEEDRKEASAALGKTTSHVLLGHILRSLEKGAGSTRARVVTGIITFVLMSLGAWLTMSMVSMFGALGIVGKGVVLVLGGLAAIGAGKWLRMIRSGQIKRSSFRGIAGISLFVGLVLGIGFLLHGLPQALINQWRRAFRLMLLEAVALSFMVMFMAATNLPGWMGVLGFVYFWGGFLLFFGCYAVGIYALLFGTVIHRDQLVVKHRKNEVYRRLLSNPDGARFVFNCVTNPDRTERKRARKLLNHFGDVVPGAVLTELLQDSPTAPQRLAKRVLIKSKTDETVTRLSELWQVGNTELRRRIISVFCRRPTSSSVEALAALRPNVQPILKARFTLANWHYRAAVWPRATRVFLLVVAPLVGMVVWHGFNVVNNPAWGQIITLGSEFGTFDKLDILGPKGDVERNMIAAANVVARHYPDKAGEHMLRMFVSGKHTDNPRVHAAMARGLVAIADTFARRSDPRHRRVRDQVIQQAGFFASLIGDPARENSDAAIQALRAMANSIDTVFADTGTHLLKRYVLNPGRVPPEDRPRVLAAQSNVIRALGTIRYERAFPALKAIDDGALPVYDADIRRQWNRVADRAYAQLIDREINLPAGGVSVAQRTQSLKELVNDAERLHAFFITVGNINPQLIEELSHWIKGFKECDRTADFVCDELDEAFGFIADEPNAESGYRKLLDYYAADSTYDQAVARLDSLKRVHRTSVWPHKLLAEIYHEHLPGTPRNFALSFEAMAEVRRLDSFNKLTESDRQRFLADFAEIALSAQQYDVLKRVSVDVMNHRQASQSYQLNMLLFQYAAEVMQRNRTDAEQKLNELEKKIASLPEGFYNNWVYPGTRRFFEQSGLPDDMRTALLELCVEGYWYSQEEAGAVIKKNRAALASLK